MLHQNNLTARERDTEEKFAHMAVSSTPKLVLLPAVDVADGKAVRLTQGKAGTETAYGDADPHHIAEAEFKAFARALRKAIAMDEQVSGIPSTKGAL